MTVKARIQGEYPNFTARVWYPTYNYMEMDGDSPCGIGETGGPVVYPIPSPLGQTYIKDNDLVDKDVSGEVDFRYDFDCDQQQVQEMSKKEKEHYKKEFFSIEIPIDPVVPLSKEDADIINFAEVIWKNNFYPDYGSGKRLWWSTKFSEKRSFTDLELLKEFRRFNKLSK